MDDAITICLCCYGDYPHLARRCLDGLVPLLGDRRLSEVRIGLNACSDATCAVVAGFREALEQTAGAPELTMLRNDVPDETGHYPIFPMMRRLFGRDGPQHGAHAGPLATPWVAWFDDDSYLPAPAAGTHLDRVAGRLESADVVGQVWFWHLRDRQHEWIRGRPWYNGRPVAPGHKVNFPTGGWWAARSAVLDRFDWPDPALRQSSGDVMLGELVRQHGLTLIADDCGVRINADDHGRPARSPRRGWSEPHVGTGP